MIPFMYHRFLYELWMMHRRMPLIDKLVAAYLGNVTPKGLEVHI